MTIIWTSPILIEVTNAMNETAKVYKWREKSVIQFNTDKVYFTESVEAAKHIKNSIKETDLRSITSAIDYVISETKPLSTKMQIPKKYRRHLIED